jgi:hypothetical protein
MIKIMLIGLAVILLACFFVSGGHAWGAGLFEILGAVWLIYCFNTD